jgi:hypothetical protein
MKRLIVTVCTIIVAVLICGCGPGRPLNAALRDWNGDNMKMSTTSSWSPPTTGSLYNSQPPATGSLNR